MTITLVLILSGIIALAFLAGAVSLMRRPDDNGLRYEGTYVSRVNRQGRHQ